MVRYAGRLSHFYDQWSLLTKDQVILSWIAGYEIPLSRSISQNHYINKQFSNEDRIKITKCINDLLKSGAISECQPCERQYLSSIFLVPKPSGKHRLILNLKSFNKHVDTEHFKLEDLRTALKLVSEGCFMSTLDLMDAYFSIRIHEKSRKYLRFMFNKTLYEFNVLPFGLSTAPFVFTKIMKPVVKLLRSCGHLSTIYLDDIFLIGDTQEACLNNIKATKQLLTTLGFIINEEKSNLIPNTTCKFLGYILDSKKFQVSLPTDKIHKIKKELNHFKNLTRCKIRDFSRLIGLLNSACPAIEYGWLYTKAFERQKYLNLKDDLDNYDKFMDLPQSLSPDFDWWCQAINKPANKIKYDDYCLEIFTDASTTGWGAACGEETASGAWSDEESLRHINYLEILAAFFGLKIFARNKSNCQILLRVDNTTAISYINRMGGVQFPHLTQVAKDLWQWCETRAIIVYASYIKSADNSLADAESRRSHPDIEWELNDLAFLKITNAFGQPELDLFASRLNKKCTNYVSWFKDPDAFAINAFTLSWSGFYFYAFPPFTMILKTLRKIIRDKATGIIVVPMWPTQPWYPLFKKLLTSKPLLFEPRTDLILSHCSARGVHRQITLAAGILSANRY